MATELIVSGNKFTVDNYYAFDDTVPTTFSSRQSLGPSLPITINFDIPVNSFTIKANELDEREATEVAVKYDNKDFYTVKDAFYPTSVSPLPRQWALGLYTRLDQTNREVIFTKSQLLEKQRKLQLIVDAFSQADSGYERRGGRDDELMKQSRWPFEIADFPAVHRRILGEPRLIPLEAYSRDSFQGAYAQLGRDALASAIFTEYTGPVIAREQLNTSAKFTSEVARIRTLVANSLPNEVKSKVFASVGSALAIDTIANPVNGDNSRAYFEPTFNDRNLGGKTIRKYITEYAQKYIDIINEILRADRPELSRNLSGDTEETTIEAFDISGSLLRSLAFTTNQPTVTINKEGIKTIKLTPIKGDYIFFSDISLPLYTPPPPPAPTPLPEPEVYTINTSIRVSIIAPPQNIIVNRNLVFRILPEITPTQTKTLTYSFNLTTNRIPINISEPIVQTALQFIDEILNIYIDEDRRLKTLVNYGEDKQSVILAQRVGNRAQSMQLKLLQPVPGEFAIGDSIFLSREVAKTVVDKFRVRYALPIDNSPYLRPLNTKVNVKNELGNTLRNFTLDRLELVPGSVGVGDSTGNITFEDEIFRKWYSYDFNSSELNIDFSDYKNFVFYSSAVMRLEAFKQKLLKLEALDKKKIQFINSSFTGNISSAGSTFVQNETAKYALEKEDIIRNFDRYEQYLYFTTGSEYPYSGSVDYQDDDVEIEYNVNGYWPKLSENVLYPVTSSVAVSWFTTQSMIAQRYDEFNVNSLINTIPTHIREDENSQSYVTFVSMIGHFFDIIKPYIDQYPRMYDRQINPNKGLSKDLINEIAESSGFKLPALNTIYDLSDNILGTNSDIPRRDYTAEAYKRLLHHLPLFAKTKGTRYALELLLRTLGISPEFLSVKEAGTPTLSSFKVFEEYSTGLDFDKNIISYIQVPLSASISASIVPPRTPRAIQFNASFNPLGVTSSVLTGDNLWGLHAVPHPNLSLKEYGKMVLRSGSIDILSSSYLPIFTNEPINVTLQYVNNSASLHLLATDGEYSIFNEVYTRPMPRGWNDARYVYVGGSGSAVLGRFDGLIDEFRLWGQRLTQPIIETNAFDPGSNAGDLYDDAANYLYVQLSFNKINENILTGSLILNESPYVNKLQRPSLEYVSASGITTESFARYSRTIRQVVPEIGGLAYLTNKVQILPEPIFNPESLDTNGVKTLNVRKSIVAPSVKGARAGKNEILISISPTEFINQNIVRNLGLENINSVLGLPSGFYNAFPKTLETIKTHYEKYYYAPININQFIRVLSNTTSVLNQVLDYFIPTRASVLKGVVIEPNILEHPRISPVSAIKLYGKHTRRTNEAAASLTGSRADYHATFNLQQTIKLEENYIVTGSVDNYKAVVNINELTSASAQYDNYKTKITSSLTDDILTTIHTYGTQISESIAQVKANRLSYSALIEENTYLNLSPTYDTYTSSISVDIINTNKVPYNAKNLGSPGAEPYNRVYPRKLYSQEIQQERYGGTGSLYIQALKEIPPSADLRDYGVRTFFNNPNGVYAFPTTEKLPAYPKPLAQKWDAQSQVFIGSSDWKYGNRYKIYDVVYQNVTTADKQLGNLTGSAAPGNGKWYVFTTRPSYTPPSENVAYYTNSVPSYIPPSLDRTNWQLLKFKPIQVRTPKRVIFDLFTVPFSALNNFKTTIVPITYNLDIPSRFIESISIGSLPANQFVTGQIQLQNIALLFALQSNNPNIRVRFYSTADSRDTDILRSVNTPPVPGGQILLDTVLYNADVAVRTLPFPTLSTQKEDGIVYFTVDNLGTVGATEIKLLVYYFTIQVEPRVPLGYLTKHYRYFRDNSTATKRRNYEGCKFTITGYSSNGEPIYDTIDGLPPVQVFVSEGTSLTVASTNTNEIITGGGGQLNVN
jgi:hypothetical protein